MSSYVIRAHAEASSYLSNNEEESRDGNLREHKWKKMLMALGDAQRDLWPRRYYVRARAQRYLRKTDFYCFP